MPLSLGPFRKYDRLKPFHNLHYQQKMNLHILLLYQKRKKDIKLSNLNLICTKNCKLGIVYGAFLDLYVHCTYIQLQKIGANKIPDIRINVVALKRTNV